MTQELTLADGTVINTTTGRPVNGSAPPGYVSVPRHSEAQEEVTRVRKRLADLPEAPEKMNIVGVIASYYLFGLDDWEIAHAVGCTEKQVGNIKMTAPFTELIDAMRQNIVEGQAEDVRTMLAEGARTGANVMLDAMRSDNEQTRVVAAKDVMDRAGFRPADVVEHKHRVEGGLTIEYVAKNKDDDLPVVDLTAEEVE